MPFSPNVTTFFYIIFSSHCWYISMNNLPDHTRRSVAHSGIFRLDEFLVIVDAPVDFVILFTC